MTTPNLAELTASEALRAIRRRDLRIADLVRSLLDRIAAIEPDVQAWVVVDGKRAMDRAEEEDARVAHRASLPLFGVPVGLKDIYATRDLPTTAGFPPWNDRVPAEDATVVHRIREAGGIILGKTVTTQFAFADPPKTRNPWNLARTPGGSSSGSAAAVSARMVPLAFGSQTAGSILRPASYCGVFGLKPSYGLVSRRGITPLAWSLDHPGPIARSVEDLALALTVIAGTDPGDPTTARARTADYLAAVRAPRAPTFGLIEDFLELAQSGVRQATLEAAETLARAGARRRDLRLTTPLSAVAAAQQTIMQVEAAEIHGPLHAKAAEHYLPRMRALVETGALVPAGLYLRAQRIRRQFREEMAALLSDVDCLVTPTASNVAPPRDTTGDRLFQAPWSLIGWPAVTVPSGLFEGLPVGLQVVAGSGEETGLLSIAAWIERLLPRLPAPGIRPDPPGRGEEPR